MLAEPGFLTPELGTRFLAELERRTVFSGAALAATLRAATGALRLHASDDDARLDFFSPRCLAFGVTAPLSGYFATAS